MAKQRKVTKRKIKVVTVKKCKNCGKFAKEYPYGKYAVTTSGHITAIIDGIIYDTFDPSDRIMRCAWKIK